MDKLWWNTVPNARRLIDDISDKINNEESLIYNVDEWFPWLDTFTSIIFERADNADKTLKVIDADDISDMQPGKYVLEKLFKPDLREKYRPAIKVEKFIAQNDHSSVLKNSIVLVKCSDENSVQMWQDFVYKYMNYHDPDTSAGCFVIENASGKKIRSDLAVFQTDDYFHKYDIDMFSLLTISSLKSENKENIIMKRYSAELASLLAGDDAELAAQLAKNGQKLAFHTEYVVKEVLNEQRSNYRDFKISGDVSQIIREAQIKIFYPEIENFRINFISKYADVLPEGNILTSYFKDSIDDINCLELGNIKFLCDVQRIEVSNIDYSNLVFYRDCRNKLAHTTLLSSDEMKRLSQCKY